MTKRLKELIDSAAKESTDKILGGVETQLEPVSDVRIKDLFDLSRVTQEDWDSAYYDYSNIPRIRTQDNYPNIVNENKDNITPIEEVEKKIKSKFRLRNFQYSRNDDGSYIVVIIPMIHYNHTMVVKAMKECGYWLNAFWIETGRTDQTWEYLRFLPYDQHDINKEVLEGKVLYHTSPSTNKNSILANGLIPSYDNSSFSDPGQVHLFKANTPISEIKGMGKKLYDADTNPDKTNIFSIFEIDVTTLPQNMEYFKDNDAYYGVFVRKRIPPSSIKWLMDYHI